MDTSGVGGVSKITSYIPQERQDRLVDLLEEIQTLLNKENPTEEDCLLLSKKLAELKKLEAEGLTTDIKDGLKILFTYFEKYWDPKEGKYNFEAINIKALKEAYLNIDGK